MSLFTATAVTRHLEAWCAEHLGRHDSPEYHHYLDLLIEALGRKDGERRVAHNRNGLFGMSNAGGCLRANAYQRAGQKGEPETGATRTTWEIGHLLECMATAAFEASGFEVQGYQEEVLLADTFKSAIDGLITSGPADLPYPLILSIKTASFKMSGKKAGTWTRRGFCALPLDGVHKAHPSWWVQAQLEMAGTGLRHCLVLVLAKDMIATMKDDPVMQESGSLSWYAELVEVASTPGFAEEVGMYHRGALAGAPELASPVVYRPSGWVKLPIPGDTSKGWGGANQEATGDYNPCFGCSYAQACGSDELKRALLGSLS